MENFLKLVETVITDNSLRDWLLAGAVFVFTFLIVPFIHGRIRARQKNRPHSDNAALELMSQLATRTSRLVLLSVALYFAEKLLVLPEAVDRVFDVVIVFGVTVQLALWAVTALRFYIDRHYRRTGADDAGARASVGVLMFVGQVLIWALFALLALDNLGVNITALVAGMGVGGIAIALAVQTILGDLFGSMSIALDKPFAVGDSLRIDDIEGTVEDIGIKSTRLRSITGEQVILSNADVLKSRVRNMGRMPERRVLMKTGVAYETAPDLVDQVSRIIERVVKAQRGTRFVQCTLARLGDFALEFETIYFVANRPDLSHGDAVDAINRGVLRAFAAAGIGLAYPTQRLLLER